MKRPTNGWTKTALVTFIILLAGAGITDITRRVFALEAEAKVGAAKDAQHDEAIKAIVELRKDFNSIARSLMKLEIIKELEDAKPDRGDPPH
jgi:hypothetical protein